MDLFLENRKIGTKAELKKIRRDGWYPGVIYNKGKDSTPVTVKSTHFDHILSTLSNLELSTHVFKTSLDEKFFGNCIVKDICYHRVKYTVEHLDFMRVVDDSNVTIRVPLVYKNIDSCKGVSEGGQVKIVDRFVKLSGKFANLPKFCTVDLVDKPLGSFVRIMDLDLKGLKTHVPDKHVLVSICK